MEILVVGRAALPLGRLARERHGARVVAATDPTPDGEATVRATLPDIAWTADPADALAATTAAGLIVDAATPTALALAQRAVTTGHRVLLAGEITDAWADWPEALAGDARLTVSRPLRWSKVLATARASIRAGQVGQPRTVQLRWTFAPEDGGTLLTAGAALVDAAAWLLDDPPARLYAAACGVAGAPLIQINLSTRQGRLALLQATIGADGHPPRRELSLLATDGALYHDVHQTNLVWSGGIGTVLDDVDAGDARELAAWLAGVASPDLAGGADLVLNRAVTRALEESLARDEVTAVAEEEAA